MHIYTQMHAYTQYVPQHTCIYIYIHVYTYMHLHLYTSVCMHCILMCAYLFVYIFAKMYDFLERNYLRMALHPLFRPDAS